MESPRAELPASGSATDSSTRATIGSARICDRVASS